MFVIENLENAVEFIFMNVPAIEFMSVKIPTIKFIPLGIHAPELMSVNLPLFDPGSLEGISEIIAIIVALNVSGFFIYHRYVLDTGNDEVGIEVAYKYVSSEGKGVVYHNNMETNLFDLISLDKTSEEVGMPCYRDMRWVDGVCRPTIEWSYVDLEEGAEMCPNMVGLVFSGPLKYIEFIEKRPYTIFNDVPGNPVRKRLEGQCREDGSWVVWIMPDAETAQYLYQTRYRFQENDNE